jgi:peptidoglycan hydrolase-like protein with peptidoglycan-binding domain
LSKPANWSLSAKAFRGAKSISSFLLIWDAMETLAYLHLAIAYETKSDSQLFTAFESATPSQKLPWKQRSRRMVSRLVSMALTPAMLSITGNAFAAILQRGDSGLEVTDLQENLAKVGAYDGPVTGFFGELTETAVIEFQQGNGLLSDGIVGTDTEVTLNQKLQGIQTLSQKTTNTQSKPELKRDDFGPEIENLQQLLQAAGYYDGPITGVFGPQTEAAVLEFQQAQGLKATGIVDQQTLTVLSNLNKPETYPTSSSNQSNSVTITQSLLEKGSTGPQVIALQQKLKQLGYYNGAITGSFDARTEAAVIRFQYDSQLKVDGVVGADTQAKLATSVVPTPSMTKDNIIALQKKLAEQGFYSGPLNGRMEEETKAAIEAAQRQYGVSSDDILSGRF